MVKADGIKQFRSRLRPADEKVIAVIFHVFPVVKRVAPFLPVLGKVIRRNPRNKARTAVTIELKAPRICPDVSRVRRNVYRHVPENFYPD